MTDLSEVTYGDRIEVLDSYGEVQVAGIAIDRFNLGELPEPQYHFSDSYQVYIYLDEEYHGIYLDEEYHGIYAYDPYFAVDQLHFRIVQKGDGKKPKKVFPKEYACPKCQGEGKWKGIIMICVDCSHTWYYTG